MIQYPKQAMAQQFHSEAELVAAYLADKLSAEERNAFESRVQTDPELLNAIHTTALFKVGMIGLQSTNELDNVLRSSTAPKWRVPLAIAASIFLVIVLILYANTSDKPHLILAASPSAFNDRPGEPLHVYGPIVIEQTRSSQVDAIISIPPQPGVLELLLRPNNGKSQHNYRVALSASDQSYTKETFEVGAVHLDKSGFIKVYLDTTNLATAPYELRITDVGLPTSEQKPTILLVSFVAPRKE